MNLEQIDTSTTAGKAEVMRLSAEGRRVASCVRIARHRDWAPDISPEWEWKKMVYAIISEAVGPDEVWVSVSKNGPPASVFTTPVAKWPNQEWVRYLRADLAGEKDE